MSRAKFFGYCGGLALAIFAGHKSAPAPDLITNSQVLTVQEAPDRVTLAWSGPIQDPMRDEIAAALDTYSADRRRIVLNLNSPGGSVGHGRAVMAAIRDAAQTREIDTLVANGGVCASMCLPIYLLGAHRTAGPTAHFMFHEVSLNLPAGKAAGHDAPLLSVAVQKVIVKGATDDLFDRDYRAPRVDPQWLAGLRAKIVGADVWKSASQLVEEGAGVVDALVATPSE